MPPALRARAHEAPPGGPAPLLYVHPRGHLNDLVVPAGAVSAMNAAPFPKLGRYAFEVTDAELRAARVVAMDLHWALGLAGLEPLLARVRAVNPAARVVVGGITASHYPRELVEALGVDHVVQGDAEAAFPALVAALLDGGEPG
ncbi:MAG TPA: cobalamin-dependent protein, partial [Anaeromyxobacter sp.]